VAIRVELAERGGESRGRRRRRRRRGAKSRRGQTRPDLGGLELITAEAKRQVLRSNHAP